MKKIYLLLSIIVLVIFVFFGVHFLQTLLYAEGILPVLDSAMHDDFSRDAMDYIFDENSEICIKTDDETLIDGKYGDIRLDFSDLSANNIKIAMSITISDYSDIKITPFSVIYDRAFPLYINCIDNDNKTEYNDKFNGEYTVSTEIRSNFLGHTYIKKFQAEK